MIRMASSGQAALVLKGDHMSFLLNIPEEIAAGLTGAVGEAFQFMGDQMAKMGELLESLSERLSALESDDAPKPAAEGSPPAAPPA